MMVKDKVKKFLLTFLKDKVKYVSNNTSSNEQNTHTVLMKQFNSYQLFKWPIKANRFF